MRKDYHIVCPKCKKRWGNMDNYRSVKMWLKCLVCRKK